MKGGSVSLKMTAQVKRVLQIAIQFRLSILEDTDELRSMMLKEIGNRLNAEMTRLKLSKYEYTCLFEKELIDLIPDQYQALLFATINPELKPIEMK